MQINSPDSLKLGRRVLRAYNRDWSRLHREGRVGADGVIVVSVPREDERREPAEREDVGDGR